MSVVVTNISVGAATVSITTDVGATEGGVTITREPEFLLIQPDQCPGPVKGFLTSESYVIAFTYIELTLRNLDEGWWGGDGDYSTGENFGGDDTPTEHADFIVYGTAPGGTQRTIAFTKVIAVEPGDYTITRDAVHSLPVKYRSLSHAITGVIGTITDAE